MEVVGRIRSHGSGEIFKVVGKLELGIVKNVKSWSMDNKNNNICNYGREGGGGIEKKMGKWRDLSHTVCTKYWYTSPTSTIHITRAVIFFFPFGSLAH